MLQGLAFSEAIDIIGDRPNTHGERIARERCVDVKIAPVDLMLALGAGRGSLNLNHLIGTC